jgi:hypothetical protein
LPVDALGPVWQDGVAVNESEKKFSSTRATSSTSGRAKSKFLSVKLLPLLTLPNAVQALQALQALT